MIELHIDDIHNPPPPEHPSGDVTAFDEATGLPIVRRTTSFSTANEGTNHEASPRESHRADKNHSPMEAQDVAHGDAAGRDVLHQSTDREELVRQAKDFARQFENGLKASTQGVKGAKVESVRKEKSPVRLDEKIEKEGQPVQTIPDILAGRIQADSHEAHEKVAKGIRDNFSVVRDEDQFKDGDPEFHYRAHKMQVQVTPQLSGEVHIVPKEVLDAGYDQHKDYVAARDADLEGDAKEEKQATAVARRINDSAMRAFEKRNKMEAEGGDGQHDFQDAERNQGTEAERGRGGTDQASRFASRGIRQQPNRAKLDQGSIPQRSSDELQQDAVRSDKGATVRGTESAHSIPSSSGSGIRESVEGPPLRKGVTVLIGKDSHGIVRGGNPNFGAGGRWSVETPDGTKTLRGTELTAIAPPKPKDQPYIGVDFDSTLATFDGKWRGPNYTGKPVPEMVDRVKQWLDEGKDVRLFTARVAEDPKGIARAALEAWMYRNLGTVLPITHEKDRWLHELYDDRARQVEPNTGKVVEA